MKFILLIAGLGLVPATLPAQRALNTSLAVGSYGAIAGDCVTTYNTVVKHPDRFVELNPFLGRTLTSEKLALICGSAVVSNYVIGRLLPRKLKKFWYGAIIVVGVANIVNNIQLLK